MKITYSPKFLKQYRRLSDTVKELLIEKGEIFKMNNYDSRLKTHKLKGRFKGYHAFSLNNKYRVIFSFENDGNIKLHSIGTHDIYEQFQIKNNHLY